MFKKKLVFVSLLVMCCCLLNVSFIQEEIIESTKNIQISSPTDIVLSTNPGSPTILNTNVYYRMQQEGTFYLSANLNKNEFYVVHIYGAFTEYYLYNDSSFSYEIKYTDGEHIMFAPAQTQMYYLKWTKASPVYGYFGIWKATKYTTEDCINGISVTYDDTDWGNAVIYFISPEMEPSWDEFDINVELPSGFYEYHTISNSSGEAYNSNEVSQPGPHIRTGIYNNPETGFLVQWHDEGQFRITLPQPSSVPPPGGDFNPTPIIIVVIAISSIIGLIYANNRYWKIGHRIQKRRREKQEVRQRIIEQKKIELEIERRKREEQARDFSDAGKKIDDVYDSWKKKDKKNKH